MFSRVTGVCAFFAVAGSTQSQLKNLPPGVPEVIRDLDRIASDAVQNPPTSATAWASSLAADSRG